MTKFELQDGRRREKLLLAHPMYWKFVFRSIRSGQNLPGLCKVLGVGYNATIGRINASKVLRKRYQKAKLSQEHGLEKKWFDVESEILEDIRKGEPELQEKRIKKLIKSIDFNFTLDDDWHEFETVFQQVHSDFFEKLKMLYPKLTPAEVRLCAMIRLNLHSKDMAAIMGISQDSLRIARYRLRKKLGLDKGSNLYTYILNIG